MGIDIDKHYNYEHYKHAQKEEQNMCKESIESNNSVRENTVANPAKCPEPFHKGTMRYALCKPCRKEPIGYINYYDMDIQLLKGLKELGYVVQLVLE